MMLLLFPCLTGCSEVLQTDWVKPSDTADVWQPKMSGLAMDVHNQASGLDVAGLTSSVANAAIWNEGEQGAMPTARVHMQRVVLYIGGDEVPTPDSFCTENPRLHSVRQTRNGIMMAAALCDGTRIVDTYRRTYSLEKIRGDGLAKIVEAMRDKLYWGMVIQPAVSDPNYN